MIFQTDKYISCFWSLIFFSIREGNGNPLQYSCLENPMDRGAWWAAVHGVVKSQARLNDFIFTFYFHALEKEMATHSSVLAWRIPGTEEPGRRPSMGSRRVGHYWSDLAAAAKVMFEPLLPSMLVKSNPSWGKSMCQGPKASLEAGECLVGRSARRPD